MVSKGLRKIPQRIRMAGFVTFEVCVDIGPCRTKVMALRPQGGWQRTAVFEIGANAPIVDDLRGNAPDSHHLAIPARVSPPGLRWYELHVDFAIGDARVIQLAQKQMHAVRTWAAGDPMPGYRIVDSCVESDASGNAVRRTETRLRDVSSARDLH